MIPCASFVPIALKQLKNCDDAPLKTATLHCIATMLRAAGADISKNDLMKPVGKLIVDKVWLDLALYDIHLKPGREALTLTLTQASEVRMAAASVFAAMASNQAHHQPHNSHNQPYTRSYVTCPTAVRITF